MDTKDTLKQEPNLTGLDMDDSVKSEENNFSDELPLTVLISKGKKLSKSRKTIEEKPCDICGETFSTVAKLLSHRKSSHVENKKFQCQKCQLNFDTWQVYWRHVKSHKDVTPGVKTIQCDVCLKEYEYINSLVQHRRVAHKDNKNYSCTLCPEQFTIYKEYKLHLRTAHKDSGVKLSVSCLVCDICGKEFLCHYNLSNHRKYNHGTPQFQCDVCRKFFKSKRSLQAHERIHTGEKPFICETCGKSFPGKSYLINHGVTHSGQKPFSCDVCGKSFSKKWNMIQHERIHTGERPYKCPLCGKSFIQNFILKYHWKKVHSENVV